MKNVTPLHLASALDRNYVVPYAVMLASLRRSIGHNKRAAAIVLHYDLLKDDLEFLNRVSTQVQIPVTFTEIPRFPFALFKTRGRSSLASRTAMSPIAYAKAFLDRFVPSDIDQLICIDADVVVVGDISGIKQFRDTDAPVAAVANIPRDHHHQFNSGFMVVDLAHWRDIGVSSISERFLLEHSESLHSHDQQTLNLIFKDRWEKIDLKWNYMEDYYRFKERATAYSLEEIKTARESPIIVHYAVGTDKPWRAQCEHPRQDLYQSYREELLPLMNGLCLADPQEPPRA